MFTPSPPFQRADSSFHETMRRIVNEFPVLYCNHSINAPLISMQHFFASALH